MTSMITLEKVWYNEFGKNDGVNGSVIPSKPGDATFGSLSVGYGSLGNRNLIGPEVCSIYTDPLKLDPGCSWKTYLAVFFKILARIVLFNASTSPPVMKCRHLHQQPIIHGPMHHSMVSDLAYVIAWPKIRRF